MNFHIPSLIESAAILIVAFLAGFGWAAGTFAFSWATTRRRQPAA